MALSLRDRGSLTHGPFPDGEGERAMPNYSLPENWMPIQRW